MGQVHLPAESPGPYCTRCKSENFVAGVASGSFSYSHKYNNTCCRHTVARERNSNILFPANQSGPGRAQVNIAQQQMIPRLTSWAVVQHTFVQSSAAAPVITTRAMKTEARRANMIGKRCWVCKGEVCGLNEVTSGPFYRFLLVPNLTQE